MASIALALTIIGRIGYYGTGNIEKLWARSGLEVSRQCVVGVVGGK
jgi:hypothetical protein